MKVKKDILLLFLISSLPLLYLSCGKGHECDCLKSTGDIVTETRSLNEFNKISLEDNINLFITEDSTFSVIVEAGKNLLSSIKTDVTDSCLYLKNENKCNWVRSFRKKVNVYLKCRKIKSIICSSASGNITSTDTLHLDHFQLDNWSSSGTIDLTIVAQNSSFKLHTGPADLNIKGTSTDNYIYAAAGGKADLRNLITDHTTVNNLSSNSCYVNVKNNLDYTITDIGDIYYTGNPVISSAHNSGSGKLIHF
jgi:hypothetical protein